MQTASYGDDSGALAMFDDDFVKNEYKSECEGRAVYDHYFCVELQWPGDKTKSFKYRFPISQTKNEWTERFPKQWEAFRNSQEQMSEGTAIELWPPLDKRRVIELKANKIYTVEQIAALSDATGPTLGLEWRKMRDQAHAFLNPSVSVVQISKLSRENDDLRNKLEAMQAQISGIWADQQHGSEVISLPKKRGRKPKITSTEAA